MDLSPNDIRNYEFAHQLRGYDREEVDDFQEDVAAALEALKQENLKLAMEIDSLKTQLAGLRQFEDTIKSAAIDARRNADLTVGNAKQEAELILSRAKTETMEIIGSRAQKVGEIEDQISKLQLAKRSYLSKLRNLIKSHLEVLEEGTDSEVAAESKGGLEVTESTEISRQKLETIATKPDQSGPIKTEEASVTEQTEVATAAPPPAAAEDVSGDQAPPGDQPVDPELAAALEKYQRKEEPAAEQEQASPPPTQHAPAPGEIVETSARAEDIPEGFVAAKADDTVDDDTGEIVADADSQQDATEHRAIDVDPPADTAEGDSKMAPGNLANELDRVAAKFEEEMDKADKN